MAVTIKRITSRLELRSFVDFPNRLYKGNPYFVPKIFMDEMDTLTPSRNPAFQFSEAAKFLAYKDGEIVGRVAAIVNHRANDKWNHKEVRFGWIDFIDDPEVSKALIDKVAEFGRQRGMERIVGPLGFTDFDPEGMLVDGFDQLCTMALIYNHPYYPKHLEAMGFQKEIDWLEYKVFVPEKLPEKIERVSRVAQERYGYRVRKITSKEVKREGLGYKIFDLINKNYDVLYNYTPLTEELIDKYVGSYLGVLDMNFVSLIEDKDGELAGVGITMPSITKALQKCGGKLFPTGWIDVMDSLYFHREGSVEMLLIAVRPESRPHGLLAMILGDLIPRFIKAGISFGETNAELESNKAVQSPWDMFEKEYTKRRRTYIKDL